MSIIRTLIVDDQRLIREGIASLLVIQEGVSIIGTAVNGLDAVQQAFELEPDVILMDVRMPEMDGIAATAEIKKHLSDCQILMLTTFDDDEYIVKSLQAGACGYLLKDIPALDLAQAIRLAHSGIYQLAPSVAGKLIGHFNKQTENKPPVEVQQIEHNLTARELEVLRLLAKGFTNREIAAELVVSEGTAKNHVSNILSCLGLRDRVQAALYAHRQGLVG
jgi:DNA-binding NarL/FixJ family response regulator